jgi:sugar phosphate isomerase/epimerase
MKLAVVLSTQAAQFAAATLQGDLAANVARIAEWGYDGVEFAIRDPRLVDGDALVALLATHRLAAPAIGTGQAWGEEKLSFTDPDAGVRAAAVARLMSHLPLAGRLGAVVIVGLLRGVVRPGIEREQAMAWLIAALRECCDEAKARGVRLALEPINRYETSLINTVDEGLELVDAVGSSALGLLLDTYHMNIEEPSIETSIRAAGPRIYHFHVADSNRWPPGGGHLDFAAILRALAATGYGGFVSGEFLPAPDAATAAQRGLAHLRALRIGA